MVQKQAYASFTMHGPHIFNIMPRSIRNLKNRPVDHMKRQLDHSWQLLQMSHRFMDTAQRRAGTNSLLDMVWIADALHRQEGGDCKSITAGGHPWRPRDWSQLSQLIIIIIIIIVHFINIKFNKQFEANTFTSIKVHNWSNSVKLFIKHFSWRLNQKGIIDLLLIINKK